MPVLTLSRLRHIHPDLFLHSEQATRIATRVAGAFSPCLYCAQPRAHPRQHLSTCIFRFGKFVCLLSFTAMDPKAADASMEELLGPVLGKRPTPSTLPPNPGKAGQAGKPNAGGRDGERAVRTRILGAQSTLSGLWRGVRPAAAGKPEGSDPEGNPQAGHLDTHASARIHIDAPLEHRLGLVRTARRRFRRPSSGASFSTSSLRFRIWGKRA